MAAPSSGSSRISVGGGIALAAVFLLAIALGAAAWRLRMHSEHLSALQQSRATDAELVNRFSAASDAIESARTRNNAELDSWSRAAKTTGPQQGIGALEVIRTHVDALRNDHDATKALNSAQTSLGTHLSSTTLQDIATFGKDRSDYEDALLASSSTLGAVLQNPLLAPELVPDNFWDRVKDTQATVKTDFEKFENDFSRDRDAATKALQEIDQQISQERAKSIVQSVMNP